MLKIKKVYKDNCGNSVMIIGHEPDNNFSYPFEGVCYDIVNKKMSRELYTEEGKWIKGINNESPYDLVIPIEDITPPKRNFRGWFNFYLQDEKIECYGFATEKEAIRCRASDCIACKYLEITEDEGFS